MLRPSKRIVLALTTVCALFLAACGGGGNPSGGTPSGTTGGSETGPGRTLAFTIDAEQNRKEEANAIADQLGRFGIQVSVREWNHTDLLAAIHPESGGSTRAIWMTDWGSATFDPYDLAVPKLGTDARGNYGGYSNPQYDEDVQKASTTVDEDARRAAYLDAQKVLFNDAPWIFGYYLDKIEAATARVQGWQPSQDDRENMHDVSVASGPSQVVIGLDTDAAQSLDPTSDFRDRPTETVIRNIFDGLVTMTPDGKVVPELAESWDVSDDGTTYTFHLRDGVTFQDGTPLSADDVVFTFQKVLGQGDFSEPSARAGLIQPAGTDLTVAKADDHTVTFTFSQPFPVFLAGLVHIQVVPKAYYEKVGAEGFEEHPIGAGPFRFDSTTGLNDTITLVRYDGYYGGSPDIPPVGPPKLDRVIFKMIPDPSARVAALKTGEIDIAPQIPSDLAATLQGDANVQVKTTQGTRAYFTEMDVTKPPFDDVRVRQALNYAINYDEILSALYGGHAHRTPTAFLPSGFGYDTSMQPYPYDPEKAVELLKAAGYDVHMPNGG